MFNSFIDVFILSLIFPVVFIISNTTIIHTNSVLRWLYQLFSFSNDSNFILFLLGILVVLFLFRLISTLVIQIIQINIYYGIADYFMELMSKAFLRKEYIDIKSETIGELDKQIRQLPMQFANFILMSFGLIFSELVVLTIILTGIVIFKFQLFLILTVTVLPIILLYYFSVKNTVYRLGNEISRLSGVTFNHTREMIQGFLDIKIYQKENFFIYKILGATKKMYQLSKKVLLLQQSAPKVLEWGALLSLFVIYWYATTKGGNNSEIILILSIYIASAYRILPSVNKINASMLLIKQYEFIIDVFRENSQLIQKTNLTTNQNIEHVDFNHTIEIHSICYGYSKNSEYQDVLQDVSFNINKGEIIGIMGRSGAGKTTLIYILSGIITPKSGSILIDNKNLNANNALSWYKHLSFVNQDIFLTNQSFAENIALGEPIEKIDVERVNKSLKDVDLYEEVHLRPKNIFEPIGESGAFLSGGQKQRLAIARALYKKTSVIIMDEATSALDEHTQKNIIGTLHKIVEEHNITLILIAHRISTLSYCNKIIRLEKGKIKDSITYQDLLKEL